MVKGTFLCLWFTVSLQDINLRKAFKSSTVQDQKVLSKESTPDSVAEMHSNSDRPPPLSALSAYRYKSQHLDKLHFSFNPHFISIIFFYREDSTDAMKFYSDPSYFFDLWKEKMLQDTEDKRRERRRQRVGVRSALIIVHLCVLQCVFHFFSVPSSNSSRSRSAAWKAALFSGRWRRWGRLEIAGRSGTWWLLIKSFAQITVIHKLCGEEHRLRARSPQMAGQGLFSDR